MDTSVDYKSVSMDMKTQNLEKASSIEMFNNSAMDTSELEIFHDMMKIEDIDGYEEAVKKYLQVEQHHRALGNTLY
ncbi:16547_t:CDS:1, partial [Gigaspora margarita]